MHKTRHAFAPLLLTWMVLIWNAPGPACAGAQLALAPGDRAPELAGYLPDGSQLRLDYGGRKLTLVNFWATWCEPCKAQMPALQTLHEAHAESGLEIIGVMNDSVSLDEMQHFAESLGVSYTVVQARRDVSRRWRGLGVVPISFLIDGRGTILRRYVGATAEQIEGLARDVEAVLEGRPMGPIVIPETAATATDADRRRALEQEQEQEREQE